MTALRKIPAILLALIFMNSAYSLECKGALFDPDANGIPVDSYGNEKHNAGWSVYLDNDTFAPSNDDEDYTYGLALTLAGHRTRRWWFSLDQVLGLIDKGLGFENCQFHQLHSLQIGLVAFTPGDITIRDVTPGDRPYASVVYLANGRHYVQGRDAPVYQTSFAIGILGLNIARTLQNELHRAVNTEEAEGWGHQISDGGEPTFRYTLARQDLLFSNFQESDTEYEIKSALSGSVGFLSDVSAALSFRWGIINTPWWSFTPERAEYIAEPAPVIGGDDIRPGSRELYVWGGVKLRARLYNAFLQGQFRDSDLEYESDDLRQIIGEAWIGVTAQISKEYRISWVIRHQTSELRKGLGDRNVTWGSLSLSRDL